MIVGPEFLIGVRPETLIKRVTLWLLTGHPKLTNLQWDLDRLIQTARGISAGVTKAKTCENHIYAELVNKMVVKP